MPELPEVETTRRGLSPLVQGQTIERVVVRQPKLRWPIPAVVSALHDTSVLALRRRAKWLIWDTPQGHLLWHLGMSGSFRAWDSPPPPNRHDHIDVVIRGGHTIRYTDPRRFGAVLWADQDPESIPQLARLGPEPLGPDFNGLMLWQASRKRAVPIKSFIMDGSVVVGVGNIYACEALFEAGIHPLRKANRVSVERYTDLASAIVEILTRAIEVGGTSLRDFTVGDGTPGYFGQSLQVYGQAGSPCPRLGCGGTIRRVMIAQRSSFYCPKCQN
jgi:formamidopyrimidine-DNA glycosylase